jgi:alanine racemase
MVDVTDVQGSVSIGDEVVLMGDDGGDKITAEEIARLMGTINYELVCGISKRVPRVYISGGKIQKVGKPLVK